MNALTFENNFLLFEHQNVLNDHIAEIKTWLISQFSSVDKQVPKFEYSSQSISHLHKLVKLSQANTRATLIVTNDLQQKAVEYSSQGNVKHLSPELTCCLLDCQRFHFSPEYRGVNVGSGFARVNKILAQRSGLLLNLPKFPIKFLNTYSLLINQFSGMIINKAARVRELLENVGLGEENLPQNVNSSVKIVASVANLLKLKDTEFSSFLIALGKLFINKTEVEEKRIRSQRESQTLLDRTRKAITKMTHFKRILQQLEDGVVTCEDQMGKWKNNLEIMAAKEKQYMQQQTNFKELLTRVGYIPEINHQVLVEMAEKKYELEEKTIPILDTLRRYRDLPPNTSLASSAIQDKTREYEVAEQYLEDLLLLALDTTD